MSKKKDQTQTNSDALILRHDQETSEAFKARVEYAAEVESGITQFERGRACGIVEATAIVKNAAQNAANERVDEIAVRILTRLEREIADLLGEPPTDKN